MPLDYQEEKKRADLNLEVKTGSDLLMNYFILSYFAIGLAFSFRYGTQVLALVSGGTCLLAYYSIKILLPASNLYQYVLSAVFGIFMAQYIYQMHGLFEMHFFAFIGSVVLVTYQNWKLQLPMLVIVILHHAVFNNLQWAGYHNVYFTQLNYLDLETFCIHIALTGVIFFVSGLWAHQLNKFNELHIAREIRMSRLQKKELVFEERMRNEADLEFANTELRRLQKEAEKAYYEADSERKAADQANKAKSIFLATMSHEIRTPMNGVIGMSSLLAETPLTEQQRGYTDTIIACGEGLLGIINDILDFSKIESNNIDLEQEDFNLRECIEDVLDIFGVKAMQTGLELVYEIDADVPVQIVGDSLRLRQILTNLVNNAIKFTTKGEIFITVHAMEKLPEDFIKLEFRVKDSGIGIAPDKQERLFKAFSQVDSSTTRKYGGTGLGLVISKRLVSLMNGEIWVQSEPGRGSTFIFSIITRIGIKLLEPNIQFNVEELAGKRILVVDDNLVNRQILRNQLESWKMLPVLAESGIEALDCIGEDEEFDLMLIDMQMPEMDGVGLAQRIKQQLPAAPIILLSSIGEDCKKSSLHLFSSILTKPIKQQVLSKHILNALRKNEKDFFKTKTYDEKLRSDFAKEFPLEILIAEDNLINQQVILHILKKLGYRPDIVNNGAEAVKAVIEKRYDMILMDMQMPVMSGVEATIVIRKLDGRQPAIVALTANYLKGDLQDCLDAGMNDYLSKPIRIDALITNLKKWAFNEVVV